MVVYKFITPINKPCFFYIELKLENIRIENQREYPREYLQVIRVYSNQLQLNRLV
jgi:hypothetical protein